MKVLLDISDDTIAKFNEIAKNDKRSRKACMEIVLMEYDHSDKWLKEFTKFPNAYVPTNNKSFITASEKEEIQKTAFQFTQKNDYADNEPSKIESLLDSYEQKKIKDRIEVLKKEIANPPNGINIPKKMYIKVRQEEIAQLEGKLNNI